MGPPQPPPPNAILDARPRAVYVHVPFCRHRCGYCDFTLVAGRDDLAGRYLAALDRELDRVGAAPDRHGGGRWELDTLFFGGGTPTRLTGPHWDRLFASLRRRFAVADDAEVTVEANPADVTPDLVARLADLGVNRVSLGVQSFDAAALRVLERDHSPDGAAAAFEAVRRRIPNVSLDLIFGVPGRSVASWRETLRRAIELGPPHVSTYGLTFEKGTTFWGRRARGTLTPADEEAERAMYAAAMDDLGAAGVAQYELSNFARPGSECRHNRLYWARRDYEAFGPGAARLTGGVRRMNHRGVLGWLKRIEAGADPTVEVDELTPEEAARETVMLALRTTDGVRTDDAFLAQTGFDFDTLFGDVAARQAELGLVERAGRFLRLTREGRFVADSVTAEFLTP